jgi:hypothetical protein
MVSAVPGTTDLVRRVRARLEAAAKVAARDSSAGDAGPTTTDNSLCGTVTATQVAALPYISARLIATLQHLVRTFQIMHRIARQAVAAADLDFNDERRLIEEAVVAAAASDM